MSEDCDVFAKLRRGLMSCLYEQCYIFLGVFISCVNECTEEVQVSLNLSVHIVCVLLECQASVICYSKDCRE